MSAVDLQPEPLERSPGHMALIWLTVAVLLAAFFGIEHSNSEVSLLDVYSVTADDLTDRAADGDAGRRLAIPGIGLLGAYLLLRRGGWRPELQSRLAWLLIAYLGWCSLSVLWSVDAPLTVRRLSVLWLCSLGAMGVASQMTLRDLCLITLAVSGILVMNSVRTEIFLGTFRPWSGGYRFAGNLHPNVQAPYCATMALAAGFLAMGAKRWRLFLWGLCAAGVVLLVLTKSRTVCGSCLAGLIVYQLARSTWTRRITIAATVLWVGCTVFWAASALAVDLEREIVNAVLIGRQEEADSLSGRVPLWMELVPHISERFLLGHGYMTFWNAQRIDSFSHALQWAVPDGHSAYIDSLLELGLIGFGLCVATVVTAIGQARRHYLLAPAAGYGFLFAFLLCRSLTAFLESAFSTPTSFPAFVMLCGFVHLGFYGRRRAAGAAERSPGPLAELKAA